MKAFLDGIPVAYPNSSLTEPKINIRRKDEEGKISIGFVGDLNFTGSDYTYIFNKLVTDPNAINNFIYLTLVDDCCNDKEYTFLIKPESLDWCEGECEIGATAVEYTPESEAYKCVDNTLIWDNWNGFETRQHPRIPYCLEFRPSLLQDAMLIFGVLTVSMSAIFYPFLLAFQTILNTINFVINLINSLVGVINDIIDAVNALGGSLSNITGSIGNVAFMADSGNMSVLNWAQDLSNTISEFVVGCNYDHPSPFVREYIRNVCDKCGIAFSSSILDESNPSKPNSDYYLLTYFSAQIRKGQSSGDFFGGLVNYIQRNKPVYNGTNFLNELKQPFNAEWDIASSTLRFERRDFFQTLAPWFDVTTYDKTKVISVCYNWTRKPRYAYGNIGYQKDAMDWVGDEAIERWSDIIEFNSPPSVLQKGEMTRLFPFGAARFREDGLDRDVLSDYTWLPFGMGQAILDNEDVMIMNNGTAFLPKLLILQSGFDWQHALVKNDWYVSGGSGTGANEQYNYPMWVDADRPGNLWDRFWYIENPRYSNWAGLDYTIKILWNCVNLNAININGTIMTAHGLAPVDSVELDFATTTMTLKGTV